MNKITYRLGLCLLLTFKEVGIPVATDFIYTAKDSIHRIHIISFTNSTIGAADPVNGQFTVVRPHNSTLITS
ncbi:hypothetical protein [Chitinophaga filiformis]|uniref:Uncharacterized protein n=1 Tax=Chitinophaga filiformis TaxID=104663 RepID=A0A1G7R4S7_CHIFI|nr:hypothetical protein [Chitinophaga filiformis]SDG05715.1 hypothetical protein SAMN04488121_103315 [Chitinophaga filiformis]